MAAKRTPQLAHQGFSYGEDYEELWGGLSRNWSAIAKLMGRDDWAGSSDPFPKDPDHPNEVLPATDADADALEPFRDLVELIAEAITTAVTYGMKPATEVIATVEAIRKQPGLLFDRHLSIEPEARVMIEPNFVINGRSRWDLLLNEEPPANAECLLPHIIDACDRAIEQLIPQKKPGMPEIFALHQLSRGLLEWSERHGKQMGRTVLPDGSESGSLLDFAYLVLEPANLIIKRLGGRFIHPPTLARRISDARGDVQ